MYRAQLSGAHQYKQRKTYTAAYHSPDLSTPPQSSPPNPSSPPQPGTHPRSPDPSPHQPQRPITAQHPRIGQRHTSTRATSLPTSRNRKAPQHRTPRPTQQSLYSREARDRYGSVAALRDLRYRLEDKARDEDTGAYHRTKRGSTITQDVASI